MAADAETSEYQYSSVRSMNNVMATKPDEIISGSAIASSGPGPPGRFHQLLSLAVGSLSKCIKQTLQRMVCVGTDFVQAQSVGTGLSGDTLRFPLSARPKTSLIRTRWLQPRIKSRPEDWWLLVCS